MTKDKELIYMLVEEINEAIYSMDSHFIKLHQNLISDELSPKQIILLDFIKKIVK